AVVLRELPAALLGAESLAEEPLEDDARVGLHRQRRRRRAPRQRVDVAAGVADIAAADGGEILGRDLQRPQLCVPTELVGRNLIDGLAAANVGAFGPLRMNPRQPDGARARVIAGTLTLGSLCGPRREVGDDDEAIAVRFDR